MGRAGVGGGAARREVRDGAGGARVDWGWRGGRSAGAFGGRQPGQMIVKPVERRARAPEIGIVCADLHAETNERAGERFVDRGEILTRRLGRFRQPCVPVIVPLLVTVTVWPFLRMA